MIDKMSEANPSTPVVHKTVNVTQVAQAPIKSETIINRTLYTIIVMLFVAVISTYFVEDLPGIVLDIRNMAIDALWLMLCCYTIGELAKRIYINKARGTKDYEDARKNAVDALAKITPEESERRGEYCTAYENELYETVVTRILKNDGIEKTDFAEKYVSLSTKEIKERYPSDKLTKAQFKALKNANAVKRVHYDPSFLNSTMELSEGASPSDMYNAKKEDRRNMITSAFTSALSGLFGVTFAGELIFSFSLGVLFSAIVKLTLTLIFTSLKANFGWNLVMKTEISRYKLQETESSNFKNWCAKNPKLQSTAKN